MNELAQILQRNQGQMLTPELVTGILQGYEYVRHGPINAALPTRAMAGPDHAGAFLVCDDRERVGAWVAQRIGMQGAWGEFTAIGQEDIDGELAVGAVITGQTDTNAFAHLAIADKAKLHLGMVRAFFDYAFNQLDLERLTAHVDADNEAALRFDLHIGFEHEFTIPKGNGVDVHQLVMWRNRCRWIKRRFAGAA